LALLQQRLQHQLEHQQAKARVLTSAHASLTAQQMLNALPTAAGSAPAATVAGPVETGAHAPAADHGPAQGHWQHQAHDQAHGHAHTHTHHAADPADHTLHTHAHSAQAYWWALPGTVHSAHLMAKIHSLQSSLGTALLRLKGRVRTEQGACVLQMAPFEQAPTVQADALPQSAEHAPGLTLIVAEPLEPAQRQLLDAVLGGGSRQA
jgi:G3E family GTPase